MSDTTPAQRIASWHQKHTSPLTWDDVHEIRAVAHQGVKHAALARRYGVTVKTIRYIVSGEHWKDPDYRPGIVRVCALPECEQRFVTLRSNRLFCKPQHRTRHNQRTDSGYYQRREEAACAKRAARAARDALWNPWRLDAPARADGAGATFGELVTGTGATSDPFAEIERGLLQDLLADVDERAVAGMAERELAALRARLASEGFAPTAQRCMA